MRKCVLGSSTIYSHFPLCKWGQVNACDSEKEILRRERVKSAYLLHKRRRIYAHIMVIDCLCSSEIGVGLGLI